MIAIVYAVEPWRFWLTMCLCFGIPIFVFVWGCRYKR